MYKETIGIVGGFGGFTTLEFFKRLLETFNSGNERDYPHIIMDNDFTMPSRTRALLYGNEIEKITCMIAESIKKLINAGADKIILVCGTAHYFLEKVYEIIPEAKDKVIDIIDITGIYMKNNNINSCYVIAAEGILKKEFYKQKLSKYNIEVFQPGEEYWNKIRTFIELVKQNKVNSEAKDMFGVFVSNLVSSKRINTKPCVIIGCTELPCLLSDTIKENITIINPLENVIEYLKSELV